MQVRSSLIQELLCDIGIHRGFIMELHTVFSRGIHRRLIVRRDRTVQGILQLCRIGNDVFTASIHLRQIHIKTHIRFGAGPISACPAYSNLPIQTNLGHNIRQCHPAASTFFAGHTNTIDNCSGFFIHRNSRLFYLQILSGHGLIRDGNFNSQLVFKGQCHLAVITGSDLGDIRNKSHMAVDGQAILIVPDIIITKRNGNFTIRINLIGADLCTCIIIDFTSLRHFKSNGIWDLVRNRFISLAQRPGGHRILHIKPDLVS